MFRGIFFSCLHYTENAPVMRQEDYGEQILKKLKWILDFAEEKEAEVFCCGDLFHRKAGTSIKEIQRIMEVMEHSSIVSILGNHDIQGYNQNLETQPIGILKKAGIVGIVDEKGFVFADGVYVTGSNYKIGYEESNPYAVECKKECDFHVHLTHGMLSQSKMPYDVTYVNEIEVNADILVNGHNHGFWYDEERGIYNVGSIARVAMEKNEINKEPKILYVEKEKGKNPKIRIFDVPVEKDVWISEIKRDTLNSEDVEKFAKSIKEMNIDNDEEILNELLKDKDEKTKQKVFEYLGE